MRILLIEDDLDFCELVAFALGNEGHTVDICNEGDDGLRWMREQAHDIVLLDRMLPRMDGGTLLKKARAMGIETTVMMMTALGSTDDKITGLDLGADDYIVKPFAVGELLARIRALARRPKAWEDSADIQYGGLMLLSLKRSLQYKGKTVSLSKKEVLLLEFFMKNPEKIIPRRVLLARVWGPDAEVEEGSLDNYIYFIRQKLKAVESPIAVITMRQMGYCFGRGDANEVL